MSRRGLVQAPRVLTGGVLVGDDVQRRTRAVTALVGTRKAPGVLGIGQATLDAAREGGRLRPETKARLLEALERAELELGLRRAS